MAGFRGRPVHVLDGDADILARDIAAGEGLHRPAEGAEQRLGLAGSGIAEDHRLAAAEGDARHGALVGHAARQPQRVGERRLLVVIGPHAAAADRRAERPVVYRDDRVEAGRPVHRPDDPLMAVEGGVGARLGGYVRDLDVDR